MKVKKMLLLASMSLAAIAFAAPAVAQANVTLKEGGTPLGVGAEVTVTSSNLVTTSAPPLTCEKVTLHYTVNTNDDTHVVLDPVGTHNATAEKCHIIVEKTTFEVHITEAGTKQLTIDTWGKGSAASTFTSQVTGLPIHCSYTGAVSVQGEVSGGSGAIVGPSLLTSACGNANIHGNATLETPNGTALTLEFSKTG